MKIVKNTKKTQPTEKATQPIKSPSEILSTVMLMFGINGYKVKELQPKKREYSFPSYNRADYYTSKNEFSLNGNLIYLYGNRIVINEKITAGTPTTIPYTYKFIANYIKLHGEKRRNADADAVKRPVETRKPPVKNITASITSKYLAVCLK